MCSITRTDVRRIYFVAAILVATLMLGVFPDNLGALQDNVRKNTPRTQVPRELVGRWENTSGSGTGLLRFTADGYFESSSLVEYSLFGCTKKFLSYKSGTMTVEGRTVTLYAQVSTFEKTDSCNPQSKDERPGNFEPERFQFQMGVDVLGDFMARTGPDGQVTVYHADHTLEETSEATKSSSESQTNWTKEEKVTEDAAELMKSIAGTQTDAEEQILGKWYWIDPQDTSSGSQGKVSFRGSTEFFRNGVSTSLGKVSLRFYLPQGDEIEITYSFRTQEEWKVHQQKLTEKLITIRTISGYLQINDKQIDIQNLDKALRDQLPKLEDIIPKKTLEESEIIFLGTFMSVKREDRQYLYFR